MGGSVTPQELAERVDDPARAPFILDVRAPDQAERWRIEGKAELASINVPYWSAITEDEETKARVPADRDVVVVCAHGDSSDLVVDVLGMANLHNLAGGMDAWATTLVPHLLMDDGEHVVVQFDRIAKACLSYVVAARGGAMAVIDPAADNAVYLAYAESLGATITDVFDTHLHADHISTAAALAAECGAAYHIAPGDAEGAAFDFEPLHDDETFSFGAVDLVVRSVATPGHTPGSTSLEVAGRFLMTGDAVFVSGVGRPDLGGQTEPWARSLFRTIHDRLARLDPALEVCPAHYIDRRQAGDDGTLRRNLGDLLENDEVTSISDEEAFVAYVVDHLGDPPAVYAEIRKVNLGWEKPELEAARELEVGRNECALSS